MRRTTAFVLLPAVSALAVLGAACSSDDTTSDAGTTTTTSAAVPTTEASTTSTTSEDTTTTTEAGTAACDTSQLAGELGPTDAGAGQVYAPVILRNTSTASCELKGFPGVSVLDGSGNQIGDPATREGAGGGSVVLAPGDAASATLHTTSEGIGPVCEPTSASMKVFPPDQTQALVFPAELTVCGGFSVTTLVAGDTGVS